MFKKFFKTLIIYLVLFFIIGLKAEDNKQISYLAQDWIIKNIPASNNKDKTIYLFKGKAQCLIFVIKTTEKNIRKNFKIKLKTYFPEGTKLYGVASDGNLKCNFSSKTFNNQEEFTTDFIIRKIDLQPKESKERAEWKSFRVVIKLPETSPDCWKLKLKMFVDGHFVDNYIWIAQVTKSIAFNGKFKKIRMGLWDYGTFKCDFAAEEIIDFYKSVGINYNQKPFENFGKKRLEERSFTVGCSTHRGHFYNKFPDVDCEGKKNIGGFPDPQALIEKGEVIIQPGINHVVKTAERNSGIATIDYEPNGLNGGFSDRSIKAFIRQENLSKDAFDKFRNKYKKLKFSIYETKDPFIKNIFRKWFKFRNEQIQDFAGAIAKGIKKINPNIKFEITCSPAIGEKDISGQAEGINSAVMAKYIDGIMPQFYSGGYDGAVAKNVALMTRKWKEEIKGLNKKCKLYPLLLIRYCGAKVFNTPARVRQQTIGSIAEGADGVVYYYVQQFDARYWNEIARTNNDLSNVENFYFRGTRVDEKFKPVGMLQGSAEITLYPGYKRIINNPNWHYTAHMLNGEVLLTLLNYSDNDIIFDFGKKIKVQKNWNCSKHNSKGTSFLVPNQEVGFVILKP